jgi:hypothetical protein
VKLFDGINLGLGGNTAPIRSTNLHTLDKDYQNTNLENPILDHSACPSPSHQPSTRVLDLPPLHFLDHFKSESFAVFNLRSLREQLLNNLQTVLTNVSNHVVWVPELAEVWITVLVIGLCVERLDLRNGLWFCVV